MQLFHDQSTPNVGESSRPVKLASRWPSDATRHTQQASAFGMSVQLFKPLERISEAALSEP